MSLGFAVSAAIHTDTCVYIFYYHQQQNVMTQGKWGNVSIEVIRGENMKVGEQMKGYSLVIRESLWLRG